MEHHVDGDPRGSPETDPAELITPVANPLWNNAMNKYLTVAIVACLATAFAAAPSFAKDKKDKKGSPEAMIKKLDTNSDGKISLEEFKAGPKGAKDPAKAEKVFAKADADSDGFLSADEFKALLEHAKKKQK
ncbi:MAG: hypothetical protein GC159_08650 [Phycisphaera sp.]|nr:hypothetical protein [Phycisphaera sp.]